MVGEDWLVADGAVESLLPLFGAVVADVPREVADGLIGEGADEFGGFAVNC